MSDKYGYALAALMTVLYAGSLAVSIPGVLKKNDRLNQAGLGLLIAAFALNTLIVSARWIESGRPPFKTLYETMLFYPWCVAVVCFVLLYVHRLWLLVPFSSAAAVAGLLYALAKPDAEIINLPPALQSGWFVPHVVTYFVSYAALFASSVLAAVSLAEPWWRVRRALPPADPERNFARFAHQAAMFGIATLTLGLVMGAAWGKFAWGDYWGWDPKENWALVSWLAYMIYLHLRLIGRWRERKTMWVLVAAFCAVVFTYLGMSLLPTAGGSLHIYQ